MLRAATDHYRTQRRIQAVTLGVVGKLWRQVTDDFNSYQRVRRQMFDAVQAGRVTSVTTSVQYTPRVLAETGQLAAPVGSVDVARFVRDAPDGRNMQTLLDEAPIKARTAVAGGATAAEARHSAGLWLAGAVTTVLADTSRAVVQADIMQRPTLTGYVRMLGGTDPCSRCVILAGKWFRWNEGFLRHPNCLCTHVPASENVAGDLTTDPYAYFNSLTKEQQDKTFGRLNARAVRDGADIFRVENIRMRGLATAKGRMRYGTPSRMTVDDIYRVAGTRTNAIRMLTQEGYILPAGQVPTGAVLGRREGFGALGGGGARRAASDAVLLAREIGRDPLNRYTMTAAERRLYDSHHRLQEARTTGMWPRSVGQSSADKYAPLRPITAQEMSTLEKAFDVEVTKLDRAPDSVRRLADLLGI